MPNLNNQTPKVEKNPDLNKRREFLRTLSGATLAAATPLSLGLLGPAASVASAASLDNVKTGKKIEHEIFNQATSRSLSLRNIHTLEKLDVIYWRDGQYLEDALLRISHHMRDHRENETLIMDRSLMDILWAVSQLTDDKIRFDVISGYRTPKTNAMLRKNSKNVAKFSYHMVGQAVDISAHSVAIDDLRKAGMALKAGGVGFYPGSRFIHLDTGPFRAW